MGAAPRLRWFLVNLTLAFTTPWYIWLASLVLYPFIETLLVAFLLSLGEVSEDGQARRE